MPFRLDTPGYDDAVAEFVNAVVTNVIEQDSVLGEIPTQTRAYPRSKIGVDESDPANSASFRIEQEVALDRAAIRNGSVAEFTSTLHHAAERYRDQLGAHLFEKMREMTEAGGTTIDAGGRPLSPDLILDALENYDFEFKDDGTPVMPQLVMNPATAEILSRLELTPEHVERLENILRRKKAEHDAHKRHRRLSRTEHSAQNTSRGLSR
jgi:hypothetical protein